MRVDRRAIIEFLMGVVSGMTACIIGYYLYPILLELDETQKYVLVIVLLFAYLLVLYRSAKRRRKKEKKLKEVM